MSHPLVRQATDATRAHAILADCGLDLQRRFGLSHWVPAYPFELLQAEADQGRVYEVTQGEELIATFTISRGTAPYPQQQIEALAGTRVGWDVDGEPALWVAKLAVRPEQQGIGIGRWCMGWIETEAVRRGARSVRLDVSARHNAAIRFYRQLGYRECGAYEFMDGQLSCFEKRVGRRAAESAGIEIRDALPGDVEAIAALLAQLDYPSSIDSIAARLERLSSSDDDRLFVAVARGEVVGLASVHVSLLIEADQPAAKLSAIVVDEQHRRQGVGEALVAAVEAEATARGCGVLFLTTAERRRDAHEFYRQVGFDENGRRFAKSLG